MRYFAEVDNDNVVCQVLVFSDEQTDEEILSLCAEVSSNRWIECCYETSRNQHATGGQPLRGNFPSAGFIYDSVLDVFLPPKKRDSWVLNEATASWEPPVPLPVFEEGFVAVWDESQINWEIKPIPKLGD